MIVLEQVLGVLSVVLRFIAWVLLVKAALAHDPYIMAAAALFIVVETYDYNARRGRQSKENVK